MVACASSYVSEPVHQNLLSKRAEIAKKLRQNLTDPAIRDAVRRRCSSMPVTDRPSARQVGSERKTTGRDGGAVGIRNLSRERISVRGGVARPSSRERRGGEPIFLQGRASLDTNFVPPNASSGNMKKSSSTGALSSGSSAPSRPRSARSVAKAQVNPEPIPLRGRRTEPQQVPADAQAALARAVASLLGDGSSSSAVSAAVQAASSAGGPLQEELMKVSKRLGQLERERQRLAENGLSVLARCSSQERTGSMPRDKAPAFSSRVSSKETTLKEPPDVTSPGEGDGLEKHPWLLADGRLVTARLEGENLALKRAVMKARREIDELLKGRAEAEARVRVLNEENTAAAEALRRCTSSLLPDPKTPGAEAGAGGSFRGGSFGLSNGFSTSLGSGGRGTPVAAMALNVDEAKSAKSLCTASGDSAAGGSTVGVGPGGGDSGGGEVLPVDKQARNKLLQTSDEISRRMEELLSRRGRTLQALLESKGTAPTAIDSIDSTATHPCHLKQPRFCGHVIVGLTTAVTAAVQMSRHSSVARSAQRRSITARTRRRSKKTKGQRNDKTTICKVTEPSPASIDASPGNSCPQNILETVAVMESPLECLDAFRTCLSQMSVKKCLDLEQPENPILRLALLEQMGIKGGYKAWLSLPKQHGVLKTLGEAAEASLVPNEDITAMGISVLGILGQERIEMHHSGAELSPNQVFALYRYFAKVLPTSFLHLVLDQLNHPSLDPLQVQEDDILSIALAAEAQGLAAHERLAQLLMKRWSKLSKSSKRGLLESMLLLPQLLQLAPGQLEEALLEQCQSNQLLVALPLRCFTWLLDSWGTQPGSQLFPVLLRPALEWHLTDLDVRRLVTVSKMFDAFDIPEAAAEVVLLWHSWAENLSAECQVKSWRWSIFQEALREVSGSRHLRHKTGQTSLGDMIIEGVLLVELLRHAKSLPLDLLLELLRRMPMAREELAADLPGMVWHFLDGRGGGLSLLAAMKIAQGEAFIKCEPNSELWNALVKHIVLQLNGHSTFEFFCRCRPAPLLREAVQKKLKGWQALEFKAFEGQKRPAIHWAPCVLGMESSARSFVVYEDWVCGGAVTSQSSANDLPEKCDRNVQKSVAKVLDLSGILHDLSRFWDVLDL
eukprot:s1136_g31.t1